LASEEETEWVMLIEYFRYRGVVLCTEYKVTDCGVS
jgi:hypothetical protein